MAHVERPTFTQPIPATATTRTEKGRRYACWVDRKRHPVKARVLADDPTRCRRTAAGRWRGCYRDQHGAKAYTPTFGDRSAALQTAIDEEKKARAVREGRATPAAPAGKVLFADHLSDYLGFMEREGFAATHRDQCEAVLRRVIAAHRLTTAGRVNAEQLAAALETDRKAGRPPGDGTRPLSLRTRNSWTATLKAFGAWLVATKRATINPFADLPLANSEKGRVRVRRHAEPKELDKLIRAARAAGEYQGLSGPDRASLYLLALYTGLRAGALFLLTPESFTWRGRVPVAVYSQARGQKAGESHGIPLNGYVGCELAAWLKAKPAGELLFRVTGKRPRTARMVRHDLAAAGLGYADGAGRVLDFHALRLSFGVMLAKAGVPLVIAQQLMQHSTPVLTANIYSRVGGELAGEVEKLPSLGAKLGAGGVHSCPPKRTSGGKGEGLNTKRPLKSGGK